LKFGKGYQVKISKRLAALENVKGTEDIKDRAWGNIQENLQSSAKESLGLNE
jgi:hypothetical protein